MARRVTICRFQGYLSQVGPSALAGNLLPAFATVQHHMSLRPYLILHAGVHVHDVVQMVAHGMLANAIPLSALAT